MTDAPGASPADDLVITVADLRDRAREVLPDRVLHYLDDGAGDQRSLAANDDAWQSPQFLPHVLVGATDADASVTILGERWTHPIALAPVAFLAQYHADAEAGALRGAAAADATYVQSSQCSVPLDELGMVATSASGRWWYQLYLQDDREASLDRARQAQDAGARAVVLTVDSPSLGARDADRRGSAGMWPDDGIALHERVWNPMIARDTSWADVERLVDALDVPILVKGVLRADDAVEAIEHGASGVVVSNHGARNLDSIAPTAHALPAVTAAVAGRVPVLVDGGLRRGTDVARALCLGADAVLVGRPYAWGLAAYGSAGVQHVVELLVAELTMAMALLGAASVQELDRDLLR